MGAMRNKAIRRDVEAADFDEAELDDLRVEGPHEGTEEERYSLGGASSDEDEEKKDISASLNGHTNEKGKG